MCFFVALIFLILAADNVFLKENTQPNFLIYPEEPEVIINANENFSVVCYSTIHIAWSTPQSRWESESVFSYIHTNEEPSGKSEYNYKSTLRLINASFSDTGYYYCHENTPDQDLTDETKFASVYLYVADDNHLSARTNDLDTFTAVQYLDAIIPCKPTSPDVDVQIYRFSGDMEKIKIQLNQPDETGAVFTYHPHKGFITNKTMETKPAVFQCSFRTRHNEEKYTYILDIQRMTDFITSEYERPFLEEVNRNQTVAGETLKISCVVGSNVEVDMNFTIPGEWDNRVQKRSSKIGVAFPLALYTIDLTIVNATVGDRGVYTCHVKNRMYKTAKSIYVNVYDKSEYFIELLDKNEHLIIHETAGEDSVQRVIKVDAHPKKILEWIDILNQTIQQDDLRYDTRKSYTFVASKSNTSLSVSIESSRFNSINHPSHLNCTAYAYPNTTVQWFFKPCWDDSCEYKEEIEESSTRDDGKVVSHLILHPTTIQNGFVKCVATNEFGEDSDTVQYCVSDIPNGFDVWGLEGLSSDETGELREVTVVTNDTLSIHCGAASHYSVEWIDVNFDSEVHTENISSNHSSESKLVINDIKKPGQRKIACLAENLHFLISVWEPFRVITVKINVLDPWVQIVNFTDIYEDELLLNRDLTLICIAQGFPKPNVVWFKDGKKVWNHDNIRIESDGEVLQIFRATVHDKGTYQCNASSHAVVVSRSLNIQFKDEPNPNYTPWIVISALLVILIVSIVAFCIKSSKEKKLMRALGLTDLEYFDKGALEHLNPDLTLDDQVALLPYYKKWEFPRSKLILGKQLGAGMFGVVVKAEAIGISEGEEKTAVAVKMAKENADYTYIKALVSELKIMIHMGQHVNVVNLLGACTKKVAKRKLLVIVEYCRYGNLHNYLLRHRGQFINQINPVTNKIDYNIGYEGLKGSFSVSSDGSSRSNYAGGMAYYRVNSNYIEPSINIEVNTQNAEVCMASTPDSKIEEEMVLSNSTIQPECQSNHPGDYSGKVTPICTKDLVTFAFQIARGMEYLASRRVLHGDLAARNILLADNNIVKICDFGLAKSMYSDYKKIGDGPLPVKWMAVESIRDRIFSTQSDVWSYGIVLWELFSLARTPYPGMEANERLCQKLMEGYRMDPPEYATNEIYAVMKDCWNAKPLARPTFTNLVQRIGLMLEESVRKHYIDLNDPYLLMNTQRLQDGHSDYLAMVSPPDFETFSSPHSYINDTPDSIPDQPFGYLPMKAGTIFSPREMNDENMVVFDHVKTDAGENIPMLERNEGLKSYANPSYHVFSKSTIGHVDICQSKDNYVNMSQNKGTIKNERHYVNGGVDVSNNEQTCM